MDTAAGTARLTLAAVVGHHTDTVCLEPCESNLDLHRPSVWNWKQMSASLQGAESTPAEMIPRISCPGDRSADDLAFQAASSFDQSHRGVSCICRSNEDLACPGVIAIRGWSTPSNLSRCSFCIHRLGASSMIRVCCQLRGLTPGSSNLALTGMGSSHFNKLRGTVRSGHASPRKAG